jgi:polar amino acid transport system substrate-binding protein
MNRPHLRSLRVATGLLLAVAATLPTGCGGPTKTAVSPSTDGARFNQGLHDRLPQSVQDRGVLRVGTDASYPPMTSFGPDGRTIIGMEPDLGVEIGRVLGVRLQFVHTDFAKLLAGVTGGGLDVAISAMTDTPERAKTIDFVNYFSAGTSIVVQRGNPAGVTDIKDLCGKVVAVERETTQVDLLARTQKNCGDSPIIMKTYSTNSDALVQLRTGRAVAVLNDLPTAIFLVSDPRTGSDYQLAATTQYEPGLYGVVVAKSQPGLRDAVQGAFEELLRSGAYKDVLAKWGAGDGAVHRISVNSGR